jgi:hypothetical protein
MTTEDWSPKLILNLKTWVFLPEENHPWNPKKNCGQVLQFKTVYSQSKNQGSVLLFWSKKSDRYRLSALQENFEQHLIP